ncbi:hypothetical protein C7N43_01435 [Sphingobacteriales bacterium UPWRP_1]|nr:hypothetical protein BVG80_10405 [Sphingobacteriales bacterium TSM_CSM]PSJ78830.1 hypothetical protein C7N43_01435 [Sphingobacteriales bacterium UPWRP_1]
MKYTLPLFIAVCLFASSFSVFAQQTTIGGLPAVITESSGLENFTGNDSLLWSHNDSGGQPDVYLFNLNGQLIHTIHVNNYANSDWEDLAQDEAQNLYIGDFGNNANNRTDLKILKIPVAGLPDTVIAQVITYHYPDQTAFPPPTNSGRNFDMEAFFYHNDSLYLFSKNVFSLTSPGTGYTKLYTLPAIPGNHAAQLIDSLSTFFPVTAADIAPSGKAAVLLCYTRMYVLYNFSGNNFLNGQQQMYNITPLFPPKQTEAIVFRDCASVYITAEDGDLLVYDFSADFPPPAVQTGSNHVTICAGDTAQLFAWGASSYAWQPQTSLDLPNAANPFVYPAQTTLYTCTAYNQIGCTDTTQVLVTVENCPLATQITCKLWLEGAYNATSQNMNTYLNTAGLLPLSQPFNRPPWNYAGPEGLSAPFILPPDVTDWVLVEIRNATTMQVVSRRAALLLSNGFLHDAALVQQGTGNPGVLLYGLNSADSYYISVQTRNHLALNSAVSQQLTTGTPADFTLPANVQSGTKALKLLGTNWAACAGDGNIDGIISFEDFNRYATEQGTSGTYSDLDFNYDGVVNIADYQLYQANVSRIGVPEIRH